MHQSQIEIRPHVWADSRRALFFERESLLAVADLHLGYAWAHRFNGQMMPLDNGHPGLKLLEAMILEFQAKRLVVLGDIVHQAVPLPQIKDEVQSLLNLGDRAELILLAGNHDRRLQNLIAKKEGAAQLLHEFVAGSFVFLHGDKLPSAESEGRVNVIGHEHPAISLGDGVSTSAKFPCFLVSEQVVVLPAFSPWAAGSPIGAYPFMSPLAQQTSFHTAVAVLGKRLLPVPLKKKA